MEAICVVDLNSGVCVRAPNGHPHPRSRRTAMRAHDAAPIRPDPSALARAFLALVDADPAPLPGGRGPGRAAVALLAAIMIALALPLFWADAVTEHAAATVPHKIALEADDDGVAGGTR
jgi:hypothetical protein